MSVVRGGNSSHPRHTVPWACLARLETNLEHSINGLVDNMKTSQYLVVRVDEERCYVASPGLPLCWFLSFV